MRAYSENAKPHRDLDAKLKGGGQRGDDVKAAVNACRRRLGAKGYPLASLPPKTDTWSKNLAGYFGDALFALGAAPSTVRAARAGRVTVGGLRMVRFPGNRPKEQLDRAEGRRSEVARRVKEAKVRVEHDDAESATSDYHVRFREAAEFSLRTNGRHYTMGSRRWEPITVGSDPDGPRWGYGDCSAGVTGLHRYALRGGPDIVNGADWRAGFTGTLRVRGERVTSGRYEVGDTAIYGGGSGEHTTGCYIPGDAETSRWWSHGSEGGPRSLTLHYRDDLSEVRRFVKA